MTEPLITIDRLKTHFFTDDGVVRAVDDVSLAIPKGRTLGLVGESGCGKSVTAMSIMRLVARPGKIVGGRLLFRPSATTAGQKNGEIDLVALGEKKLRSIRGGRIAMIFQEPMSSLNPVFTIGKQITEAIRLHQKTVPGTDRPMTPAEAKRLAISMLEEVRIPEPARRFGEYPHQFSGGMRQRAMIAMALSCRPELLIADEPTTALDVTIQAQILDLLRRLQKDYGMSILMITHDLGIIAELADEVAVMYASKVVERAPAVELYHRPLHPYTIGLFASRPELGQRGQRRLPTIEGAVPHPRHFPPGCKFHPRCRWCQEVCRRTEPELREISPGHLARCHFAGEITASYEKKES
jgi:oligopeptide/dipeptide ABC transporter ATP-binding protein